MSNLIGRAGPLKPKRRLRRRTSIPLVLWHGTTAENWSRIQSDERAVTSRTGQFSSTAEFMVAVHFAYSAICIRTGEGVPVVLQVDAAGLLEQGFDMTWYEDKFFGEGMHRWEQEVAIWQEVPVQFLSFAGEVTGIPRPPFGWPESFW